jgi:peptide/nickel transport system substrate-binding protein
VVKRHVWTVTLLIVLLVTACAKGATPTPAPEATELPATATPKAEEPTSTPMPEVEKEAAMLAELVGKGELPPLEQRLPDEPLVVDLGVLADPEHLEEFVPGKFGGSMRMVHHGNFNPDVFTMMMEGWINSTSISTKNLRGNVFKDFGVSDDYTTFTFTLRRGLKWSDGEPVTMEDIQFVWEDLYLNEGYGSDARPPGYFRSPNGDDGVLTIIDDWTFQMQFTEPYGGFLTKVSVEGWVSYDDILKPKHYLMQYHPDYAEEGALKTMLADAELAEDEWGTLLAQNDCTRWQVNRGEQCLNFPVLYPWYLTDLAEGSVTVSRNPYYWKVDTEGKQLPYIDDIVSVRVDDVEMVQLKSIAGEADFYGQVDSAKLPLYMESAEKGGYEVRTSTTTHNIHSTFKFYTCNEDPIVGPLLKNLDFRKAVNLAIDLDEIVESVYLGFATPLELVPNEYDPDKANQMLDDLGLDQRDGEGFRLAPDGSKLQIELETPAPRSDMMPVAELIVAQLAEVGIRMNLTRSNWTIFREREGANEIQTAIVYFDMPVWPGQYGRLYAPYGDWCLQYEQWFNTEGETGIEPPAPVYRLLEIRRDRVKYPPYSPEDAALLDEVYEILHEQLYFVPSCDDFTAPIVVNEDLRNVPSEGMSIAAAWTAEQWWFDR